MTRSDRKFAIELAKKRYTGPDLEIEDFPPVKEAEGGAWIRAWVWVPTVVPKRGGKMIEDGRASAGVSLARRNA